MYFLFSTGVGFGPAVIHHPKQPIPILEYERIWNQESAGIVRPRQALKIVQQETAEDAAKQKRRLGVEASSK